MQANARILIVDDNPIVGQMMERHLNEEFDVNYAENYSQCQQKIVSWHPDIIVLDVEMPGRNGYEICDALKQSSDTEAVPVVFHSANDSLRERMLGYEVGGVDYLLKGCEPEEIRAKLHAIAKQNKRASQLERNAQNAEKTALEALSTSFELGKAVRFVEQSYTISDFDEMGRSLVEFGRDLSLSAVVMFGTRDGRRFYSTSAEDASPIEKELMGKLHSGERFVDFGCRTLVNYPQVSILVKNMPIEDRESYGRIKDTLPFVLGATDAKVRMLGAELALTAQCTSLSSSIEAAKSTLDCVKGNFRQNLETVATLMSELIATIQLDIQAMNMDEADEEQIIELVEQTSKKLHVILTENSRTDKTLHELVTLLEQLTAEQNRIVNDNLSSKVNKIENDFQNDVELF